jgi:thioredoxin reductase (NADPH)
MAIIRDYDVVIVGAGPAGMTAALYAGRAMLRTVVLEAGLSGGELLRTEYLDDVIGFPMIKGDDLAQRFEEHAKKFGAQFVNFTNVSSVQKVDTEMFAVETDGGDVYMAPVVIVTSGGTPVKLGIPGELEFAGRGVSYCAICDANFFRGETIAVVGGGDAACEEADYLTRFANRVYVIHRRDEFRASKVIQNHVFANPKIEVVFNTVAEEVLGEKNGSMKALRIRDVVTLERRVLDVTGLFVFIGFKPNTDIIKAHYHHDPAGYIVTDGAMMSSIPGLFVAGDLRSQLTRQVTTASGDATTAAIAADKYLKDLREAKGSLEKVVEEAVQTSHLNLGGWT